MEKYAKLIEEKRFESRYADTECLDKYESNCETVEEFLQVAGIQTPMRGHTTCWAQAYIDKVEKTDIGYNVKTILPFTD